MSEKNENNPSVEQLLQHFMDAQLDFDTIRSTYDKFLRKPLPDPETLEASEAKLIRALRKDGIAILDGGNSVIGPKKAQKAFNFLQDKPVYSAISPNQANKKFATYRDASHLDYSSYDHETILSCPELKRLLSVNNIENIARYYLEAEPYLSDMHCFWSYPQNKANPFTQYWHRDWDDWRFLSLFVFLTDVNQEHDGAHKFIRGSHLPVFPEECQVLAGNRMKRILTYLRSGKCFMTVGLQNLRGYTGSIFPNFRKQEFFSRAKLHPVYENVLSHHVTTIMGPKGTAFLEDPGGLHLGLLPKTDPRLIFWVRYGLTPKTALRSRYGN